MAKLSIEEIIAAVEELTVLELNDLVKAAEEKMQEATSVESNMTMDMVMTSQGQTVNMKTNMENMYL